MHIQGSKKCMYCSDLGKLIKTCSNNFRENIHDLFEFNKVIGKH